MTDIALTWRDALMEADIALDGARLATDDGLLTAILISLFTDAPARPDDVLPAEGARGGWWGDAVPAQAGDVIGSRLWLLSRAKRLADVAVVARGYAEEALKWLLDDGVVAAIAVETAAAGDVLAIGVTVTRPAGGGRQRYDFTWSATARELSGR
ncbi:phage GP46 family protein [Sphingomonas naphthae]|uniref:Phage GP46 family protein n=1 Tax=Sphingomonas naphthae TaxID=1813468 RepID=A0ABY7TFN2_9SPHN|nr:phage GP46 family protein [Sphingomonas naphthae]WCT72046.1 phage GP46 family protein [Sphingomonas naphthae]